jgi:hypothetical protein
MPSLIFNGYPFANDLFAKWFLQNTLLLQPSETQEMQFQLLDYQGNGFEHALQKVYGSNPNFVLRKQLNGVKTDLLSFDGTSLLFKFKAAIDMGGKGISNAQDPVNPQDVATKAFVLANTGFSKIVSGISTGIWVVPAGVTKIKLILIGGGGGGAGSNAQNSVGEPGGGGGATTISYKAVTPGQTLNVTIGQGGLGGAAGINNGASGTETKVTSPNWSVSAAPGSGAVSSANPGGSNGALGGLASSSLGDFKMNGGQGGPGITGINNNTSNYNCAVVSGFGGGTMLYPPTPSVTSAPMFSNPGISATPNSGCGGSGATGLYGPSQGLARAGGNGGSGCKISQQRNLAFCQRTRKSRKFCRKHKTFSPFRRGSPWGCQ